MGLFALDLWKDSLAGAGFEIHQYTYAENGRGYTTFACVKPEGVQK